MTTRIYRDRDGWRAETQIDLEDRRVLKLRTSKCSMGRGLQTVATVWSYSGNGLLSHAMDLGTGYGDFREIVVTTPASRITEKLVTEQHDRLLKQVDAIRVQVGAFYALKGQKNAVPA